MVTEHTWIELAKYFGIPTVLFMFILWTGYHQKWVWGHQLIGVLERLTEMRQDRDFWRSHALSQTRVLEKATDREAGR